MMKRFVLLVVALALCVSPSFANRNDGNKASLLSHRQLDNDVNPFWFLVSQIRKDTSWCITVITDDAINLRRCDFNATNKNKNQLWSQTADGRLYSALDNDKCLDFNPYDSNSVRLKDCDTYTGATTEFAGFSSIGPIKAVNDDWYCLTNRGINPNPSDPILAKKCLDRPDYKWMVVPSSVIGARRVMIRGTSGCLQPRDHRVYLDECDETLAWHHEVLPQKEGSFLLHSALDDSLCLRAGRGSGFKDGTWMRLAKCNHDDSQQHVVIGPSGTSLHVANNVDFCMQHAGINPNVGKDIIIMKSCAASNPAKPWNLDYSVDDRRQCVPLDAPHFVIDDDVNIGDTLYHPGPGFARSCGMDCYRVKDSGDDPPFDPEFGDTLRFAYKKVSSRHFSLRAKVCGVNCDGGDVFDAYFGRTGLMIRESLDPLAKNIFPSHSPDGQAEWSYRSEYGGGTYYNFDGSSDVPCLWITLERKNDDFFFSYAYEGQDECDMEPEFVEHLNSTVTIDMPDDVFVGLAVSTGVQEQGCWYTEAEFRHIQCDGCESARL